MAQPVIDNILDPTVQKSQEHFNCWQVDVRRVGERYMSIMYLEYGTRGWKFKVDVPADALPSRPLDVPWRCTFTRVRSIGRDMLTEVQLTPGGDYYPIQPLH